MLLSRDFRDHGRVEGKPSSAECMPPLADSLTLGISASYICTICQQKLRHWQLAPASDIGLHLILSKPESPCTPQVQQDPVLI